MTPEAAQKVVNGLREAGFDFVAYLPETRMSEILPVLRAAESFTLVPVASEAEAVGIAAGASLGGKQPAVYMEGTGVFVSAYNLLTVGERYGVPMLLLVSYIGSMDDRRSTFLYSHYGTHMTAQLDALGIQYEMLREADDVETRIKNAARMMHGLKQPVALLFTGDFTVQRKEIAWATRMSDFTLNLPAPGEAREKVKESTKWKVDVMREIALNDVFDLSVVRKILKEMGESPNQDRMGMRARITIASVMHYAAL